MDSLFGKMAPNLRALTPPDAAPGHACEGGHPTPARSVQVSAHRSSTSQLKSSKVTAPSAEETATASFAPPFNPLPLPASRFVLPGSLRLFWFNRRGETRDPDFATRAEPDEKGEIQSFCDNWETGTKSQVEENSAPFPGTNGAGQGDLKRLTETDTSAATFLSDALTKRPDSTKAGGTSKSWMSRLLDLRAFWPDSKKTETQTKMDPPAELQAINPGVDKNLRSEASRHESCSGCEANSSQCCSLEVPYARVLHSKESFSKFLQDVSLFDMKVIAQMSFLCDLAYTIPDIQPGQLLKYHHLRFVTSSLDRKAEAAASDSSGKDGVNGPILETKVESQAPLRSEASAQTGIQDNASSSASDPDNIIEFAPAPSFQDYLVQSRTALPFTQEVTESCSSELEESLMAVAPATAVVVAEEETKQAVVKDLQSSHSCPCEWYICDDHSTQTRIFVIQGSESLASWQANLLFEPMKFEELDVLVHRGIYEAANGLYELVLPEVLAHFKAHGDLAQIRLTGHSLGGSLAALLALMFQIRGALPCSAILPVITFGSPCVMCGGDYLLQKLNLPQSHIQSVIMHRDVVPRAFSCDYPDHVAQVLKRLNGRFRNHPCLNNQKLLYAPMGQLLILQPDEAIAPSHPLLPIGHGLYLLRHPINGEHTDNAIQLRAAQRAFLNMPHPLEILSDPGAYGFEGAISRDHDPHSYTKAVHVVLRHEVRRLRRLQREQRRHLWWPLVIAESSLFVQRGVKVGMHTEQSRTSGAITPSVNKPSLVFKQSVNYSIANRIGLGFGNTCIWGSHKDAFSRYTRLIASQHVQMGMLFILSVRVMVLEGLSTLFVWI